MQAVHLKMARWFLFLTCAAFLYPAKATSGFIPLPLITPAPPVLNFDHLNTSSIEGFEKFLNKNTIAYVNKNNVIEPSVKIAGKKNPAVVIVSEYSPLEQFFYFETIGKLKENGFYVFLLNVNVSSRKPKNHEDFENERESFFNATSQAYMALEMLAQHPSIDPEKIGVFGLSAGGVVARMLMDVRVWHALAQPHSKPFAVHVDYADQCHSFFEVLQTTGAPLLTIRSELNRKEDRQKCMESEAQLSQGGSPVDVYGLIRNNAYGDGRKIEPLTQEAEHNICLPNEAIADFADKFPILAQLISDKSEKNKDNCVSKEYAKSYAAWQYFFYRKLLNTFNDYLKN